MSQFSYSIDANGGPILGAGTTVIDLSSLVTEGVYQVYYGFWIAVEDPLGLGGTIVTDWVDPNGTAQSYNDPLGLATSFVNSTTGGTYICKGQNALWTVTITIFGASGTLPELHGNILVP